MCKTNRFIKLQYLYNEKKLTKSMLKREDRVNRRADNKINNSLIPNQLHSLHRDFSTFLVLDGD